MKILRSFSVLEELHSIKTRKLTAIGKMLELSATIRVMPKITRVRYHVKKDSESLALATAEWITAAIEQSIVARGTARIAISGGNTPKRAFALLADPAHPFRNRIDWSRLLLFWVDERCVSPTDSKSNFHMTSEVLLSKVPLPKENIVRVEGELDPEEAASRYESELRTRFRMEGAELPRFDLIHLGLGDNGHTASLFPHSDALDSMMRLAVSAHVEAEVPWRVTLTWPVINHAAQVIFQVQDASKADVLHRVLQGSWQPDVLPAQLIRPESGELTLLLDAAAASLLPPPAADGTGLLEVTR
jgi:6-phosphogluconolactonase